MVHRGWPATATATAPAVGRGGRRGPSLRSQRISAWRPAQLDRAVLVFLASWPGGFAALARVSPLSNAIAVLSALCALPPCPRRVTAVTKPGIPAVMEFA